MKHICNEPSSFYENDDCVKILKKVLDNKENIVSKNPSLFCRHRNCNKKESDAIIFGGYNTTYEGVVRQVVKINGNNFKSVKNLCSMKKGRKHDKAVYLKGGVYVLDIRDDNRNWNLSVENDRWSYVTDMYDDRHGYCVCAFMNKTYVFGGRVEDFLNSTLEFDPNYTGNNKWKEVARINQARRGAACTVFEGKIVVSGGYDKNPRDLNTIESYDVIGNAEHDQLYSLSQFSCCNR